MTDPNSMKPAWRIAFLREMANYWRKLDAHGEDRAHWAGVYNAENCEKIAALIEGQELAAPAPMGPLPPGEMESHLRELRTKSDKVLIGRDQVIRLFEGLQRALEERDTLRLQLSTPPADNAASGAPSQEQAEPTISAQLVLEYRRGIEAAARCCDESVAYWSHDHGKTSPARLSEAEDLADAIRSLPPQAEPAVSTQPAQGTFKDGIAAARQFCENHAAALAEKMPDNNLADRIERDAAVGTAEFIAEQLGSLGQEQAAPAPNRVHDVLERGMALVNKDYQRRALTAEEQNNALREALALAREMVEQFAFGGSMRKGYLRGTVLPKIDAALQQKPPCQHDWYIPEGCVGVRCRLCGALGPMMD